MLFGRRSTVEAAPAASLTPLAARRRALVVAAVTALAGLTLAPAAAQAAAHRASPYMQLNYGFHQPDAAAIAGDELFVANKASDSLTIVNAASGHYMGNLKGARSGFDAPAALQAVSGDLFVANRHSVTELNVASLKVVRTLSRSALAMASPVGLASEGPYLFVLGVGGKAGAGAVDKVNVASGTVVARATGSRLRFDAPTALAAAEGHVFVADSRSNAVTELDAATMTLRRVLTATGPRAFARPTGVVAHGDEVWVTNLDSKSVTELAAGTGRIVQVVPNTDDYLPSPTAITWGDGYIFVASPPGQSPMVTQVVPKDPARMPWMMCNSNAPYTFSNPQAMAVYGTHLWVVNEGGAGGPPGDSLTEMDAATGKLLQVLR